MFSPQSLYLFPLKRKSTWLSSIECCGKNNKNERKLIVFFQSIDMKAPFSAIQFSNNKIFTEKTGKKNMTKSHVPTHGHVGRKRVGFERSLMASPVRHWKKNFQKPLWKPPPPPFFWNNVMNWAKIYKSNPALGCLWTRTMLKSHPILRVLPKPNCKTLR